LICDGLLGLGEACLALLAGMTLCGLAMAIAKAKGARRAVPLRIEKGVVLSVGIFAGEK